MVEEGSGADDSTGPASMVEEGSGADDSTTLDTDGGVQVIDGDMLIALHAN